jgi:hypothetical protein
MVALVPSGAGIDLPMMLPVTIVAPAAVPTLAPVPTQVIVQVLLIKQRVVPIPERARNRNGQAFFTYSISFLLKHNNMKRSIKSLVRRLKDGGADNIQKGYSSIRGGLSMRASNDYCSNEIVCSSTNAIDCVNTGHCEGTTNKSGCSNPGSSLS